MEYDNIHVRLMKAAIQQSSEEEQVLRQELQDLHHRYLQEVKKLRALKLVGKALDDIDDDPVRAFDVFSDATKMPNGRVQKKVMMVFRTMKRPLTVGELGFILGRSPQSLATVLRSLCKRGHLTRISRGLYAD